MIGPILATSCFQEFALAIAMKPSKRVCRMIVHELTSNPALLVTLLLNSNMLTIGLTNATVLNPADKRLKDENTERNT